MRATLGVTAAVIGCAATAAVALVPAPASDSRVQDRDGDGLSNGFELRTSKTNPRKQDTDADGYPDRVEVRRGSNPRRASSKCDRIATNAASLSSEFRAARPGKTVCLASGDYGRFRGGAKRGVVKVRAQPGESANLSLHFDGAKNIRIEDVTITGGLLSGGTQNVTVAHSRFTGILVVDQETPNPNITLSRNTHNNIPGAPDDYTSRVHLDAPGWW